MITTLLFATTLVLAGILGFVVYVKYTEIKKYREEKQRRYSRRWSTVFERTDLKKAHVAK